MRRIGGFATVGVFALAVVTASAQPIVSAKSGVVAGVEGKVLIDKQEVQQSVTHFPEVKEGSILSTEDGRVELMLPPGFMLRLGENGALKMVANRLVDTRVDLQAGSAVVEVDQTKGDYSTTIALKDAVVTLSKVGVYRFDSEPAQLKIFHGSASVEMGGETFLAGTGRVISLTGTKPAIERFDVEQTDALDNWSRRRGEAMALANISGAKYANDNYSQTGGSGWMYNPYFDMYTYIPTYGSMCNPFYGMCFYSPAMAYQMFYLQPMIYGVMPNVGGRTLNLGNSGTASSGVPVRTLGTASASPTSAVGSRSTSYANTTSGATGSSGFHGGSVSSGGFSGGSVGSAGGGSVGGGSMGAGAGAAGHASGGGAAGGGAHGK